MVDWVLAIGIVKKVAGGIGDTRKLLEVKTYADKVGKMKPEEIKPADLNYFKDNKIAPVLEQNTKIMKKLEDQKGATCEVPESDGTGAAYAALAVAIFKHGPETKEAEKAAKAWQKACEAYRKKLIDFATPLREAKTEFGPWIIKAQECEKFARKLMDALEILIKLPAKILSTAPNAKAFEMYTTAEELAGVLSRIADALIALQEKNHDLLEEVKATLTRNDKWIKAATKAAGMSKQQAERNRNAEVPV